MDVIFDWNLGNMIYNDLITLRHCGFPFAEIGSFHVTSTAVMRPWWLRHGRARVYGVHPCVLMSMGLRRGLSGIWLTVGIEGERIAVQ